MSKAIDLTGKRFGRLMVIKRVGTRHRECLWECKCDCGKSIDTISSNLRTGHTKSCGCLVMERTKETNTKHGLYGTRIHGIYTNMKTRCYNPKYYLFHRYGGRGISVCDEWLGENGLKNFYNWSMNNGYSEHMSIDRIDNDKGYRPDNCRWVSMKQQQNNRTNNRIITVNGEAHTMREWSEIRKINYATIQRRLASGWSEERAVTVAPQVHRKAD